RIMALAYGTAKWDNEFNTMAGFFSGEYKLDEHLTPFMNFGIAQSPPSLTELYALSPFLAVVQNGLNSVIGNPALTPEQAWQLEFGLRANYERFRGGFNLFGAWIHNYITFQTEQTTPFQLLRFVNTDEATLFGAEWYGEYDLTC